MWTQKDLANEWELRKNYKRREYLIALMFQENMKCREYRDDAQVDKWRDELIVLVDEQFDLMMKSARV